MNNQTPEVFNLFPTTVAKYYMERDYSIQEQTYIVKQLESLIINGHGNSRSENDFILRDPAMKDLKDWISSCLTSYVRDILCVNDINPYITESWINIARKGQPHSKHYHSNSFLSGVLYYQTNDTDKINFVKNGLVIPNTNFVFNHSSYNIHNSVTWWLPATKCTMLIFPSTLEHEVPPNESEENRISISFNSFWKGIAGGIQQSNSLVLY